MRKYHYHKLQTTQGATWKSHTTIMRQLWTLSMSKGCSPADIRVRSTNTFSSFSPSYINYILKAFRPWTLSMSKGCSPADIRARSTNTFSSFNPSYINYILKAFRPWTLSMSKGCSPADIRARSTNTFSPSEII